jgi:hypothetical protein
VSEAVNFSKQECRSNASFQSRTRECETNEDRKGETDLEVANKNKARAQGNQKQERNRKIRMARNRSTRYVSQSTRSRKV